MSVDFHGMDVKNVINDTNGKGSHSLFTRRTSQQTIDPQPKTIWCLALGCCTDTSYALVMSASDISNVKEWREESWDLWKNIAAQAKSMAEGSAAIG